MCSQLKPAFGGLLMVGAVLCCGDHWLDSVPPKYVEVAKIHHSSCGACHARVEPGERTREHLEKALAKHHSRVKMTDEQWAQLIDYLSRTP